MSYSADIFVADEIPTTAKWNKLWNNDASFNDGTGIADSAILPKHLLTGTGSTYPWTAWTPSISAVSGTFTSVSATGKYTQLGKIVVANGAITITTNGTAAGAINSSLPVTAKDTNTFIGSGRADVVSGKMQQCRLQSASLVNIYDYSGLYGGATGEVIRFELIYEAA